jgi:hypothetical protein
VRAWSVRVATLVDFVRGRLPAGGCVPGPVYLERSVGSIQKRAELEELQSGVREMIEVHQLAPDDPAVERLGEARGADDVARSKGDQGRSVDLAQCRASVVGEDSIGGSAGFKVKRTLIRCLSTR